MPTSRPDRPALRSVLAGCTATLLLGLAAPNVSAAASPNAPAPNAPSPRSARPHAPSAAERAAAHRAAESPAARATLARFFAREGARSKAAAKPRVQGEAVPVYYLSPEFVAGKRDAPVAKLEFLASKVVSADGQEASLWTVERGGRWQVVNIATGDDETHYARVGAKKLPGGTVFHEPQINAWYVQGHARVLPLDQDATAAIGSGGTSLAAYQKRVEQAYGDKLPGSRYAESGRAGGYGPQSGAKAGVRAVDGAAGGGAGADPAVTIASTAAGLGALGALILLAARALRLRRR